MEKKITNFAINVDPKTLQQFKDCYSQRYVVAASLMPDAHLGYVAPIGAVLITKDYVVPSWVGFDIGCGMIAVRLKAPNLLEKIESNKDKIYSTVSKRIPMGLGEVNKNHTLSQITLSSLNSLLSKFQQGPHDKKILGFIKQIAPRHLGTLGSGNHFIELSYHQKEVWLVIHSGSRGLGYKVAEKYMKKAASSEKGFEKTFPLKVNSELGKEYLNILDFGLEFALLNRLEMSYRVKEALSSILKEPISHSLWVNKNHNHAILERSLYIHRKGATPAKKGERGVIPANMRDGSFLVEGLGSSKFLNSSSHGAGRSLSRHQAKKTISLPQFKDSMQGIKAPISQKFLDEAPQAYKNIDDVMQAQKSSVKIIKHLSPLINWKG